jgi:hypothetical protein
MWSLTPVPELYLQVRFPGEIHDVKEFIQPRQWHVQKLINDLRDSGHNVTAELLWDWVCRNVDYPLDQWGRTNEYHRMDAYAVRPAYILGWGPQVVPRVRQTVWSEWFDWPWEILSSPRMVADCDGSSILLASLIRGIGVQSYVAVGGFAGEADPLTHAWVVCSGQSWEVTTDEAGLALPEYNDQYIPLLYFNDAEILVAPQLNGILKQMNYVPTVDQLCGNFGFTRDSCKKFSSILALHRGLKNNSGRDRLNLGARR